MKRTAEAVQVGVALVLVLGVTLACKRPKKDETSIVSTPATTSTADDDDDDDVDATPLPPGTATGTATAATGATVAAKSTFKVGDKVVVLWKGTKYDAKIIAVQGGDKYKIHYVDWGAEWDETVGLDRIVGAHTGVAAATATAHATGGGGGGTVKTGGGGGGGGDAPCPGPGITRRCGGVCVNLQTDDRNCGGCGTVCSGGKHCDGHLFCRDAEGNL